ncbi:MAG: hypothetical protein ACREP2_10590 [Rhodanobacteraceae bacterium]
MSATMMPGSSSLRRGLFVLGLLMLFAGGIVAAVGFNSYPYWWLGVLACVVGVWLMRISKSRNLIESRSAGGAGANSYTPLQQHPSRLAWILGAVSAGAVVASFVALYMDAVDGYRWMWPLYAFVACAIAATLVWSYLFAKMGWFV